MAARIKFIPGNVVFRNTWMNTQGHIRTNLYDTRDKAIQSAKTSTHRFQEIATPVQAEQCLINPEYY